MPGGVVGQGSGVGVVGIVVGSRGRDLPALRRRAEFVEVARIIPYRETVVRRFRAAYEGDGEVLVGMVCAPPSLSSTKMPELPGISK